ncbi:MAG TPA: beta-propeller fold lactonase family protein [Terriglobales bacterium]|nr:beta-propeller fold lactonase family protein [Terriglobales bacterium]
MRFPAFDCDVHNVHNVHVVQGFKKFQIGKTEIRLMSRWENKAKAMLITPLLATLVLFCANCGGNGNGGTPPTTTSGGGGGGTPTGTPVYVSNSSGSVSVYLLSTSGSLQTTTASPVSTSGSSPESLAADPALKHLLVTNLTSGTTAVFSISSTDGSLTPVTGSPFPTSLGQVRILFHPNGNFVYTLVNSPSEVIGYSFSATTGALAQLPGFPVTLGFQGASGMAITSDGNFLYAADNLSDSIDAFSINASTGAITLLGTVNPTNGSPAFLSIDNANKFLFAVNSANGTVSALSIAADGTLSEITGSPFGAGTSPVSSAFAGGFLFVANQSSGNVSVFSENPLTGQLTPVTGSPFAAGARPNSLAVSGNGKFLIVTSSSNGGGAIFVFSIGSDGTLTPVSGSPFAPDAQTPNEVVGF